MWRTIKAIFWLGLLFMGAFLGAAFLEKNEIAVNVVFPFTGRETGTVDLGLALLGATGLGVAVGLVLALFTSLGMTVYAARLKREIRSLRKEVDALRNLPILEEELDRATDDDDEDDVLSTARSIDVPPPGPVRGGSTAAPIGGDDDVDDDDDDLNIDKPEDETRLSTGSYVGGGTRKIDVS